MRGSTCGQWLGGCLMAALSVLALWGGLQHWSFRRTQLLVNSIAGTTVNVRPWRSAPSFVPSHKTAQFASSAPGNTAVSASPGGAAADKDKTVMIAISSHHIYNKNKKRLIVKMAEKFKLTGMYKFGKPGRIVIEGPPYYIKEYTKALKSQKWQRLQVVDERVMPGRSFDTFAEVETDPEIRTALQEVDLQEVFDKLVRPW